MNFRILFSIISLLIIIWKIESTIVPIYANSDLIYVDGGTAKLTTNDKQNFTVTVPITISIASYRKPFFSISSVQDLKFDNNQAMYWWTRVYINNPTSFNFEMQNYLFNMNPVTFIPVSQTGFLLNKTIKFRYMVLADTVPNKYYSDIIKSTATPITITNSSAYSQAFSIVNLVSPSPPVLSLGTNTKFFYSLTDIYINSSMPNNQFSLQFSFNVINLTNFNLTVTSNDQIIISDFGGIMMFIYNKDEFQNNYQIKFQNMFVTFTNLLNAPQANQLTTSYPATASNFVYGVSEFRFSGYQDIGFDVTIPTAAPSTSITVNLENLFPTSQIPSLKILVVLGSQLRCPNYQLFINQALTECYPPGCPTNTFNNSMMGLSNITVCKRCEIYDSNCATCNSTKCISCSGNFVIQGAACVSCQATYGLLCLTCNSFSCLTCQTDEIIYNSTYKQCVTFNIPIDCPSVLACTNSTNNNTPTPNPTPINTSIDLSTNPIIHQLQSRASTMENQLQSMRPFAIAALILSILLLLIAIFLIILVRYLWKQKNKVLQQQKPSQLPFLQDNNPKRKKSSNIVITNQDNQLQQKVTVHNFGSVGEVMGSNNPGTQRLRRQSVLTNYSDANPLPEQSQEIRRQGKNRPVKQRKESILTIKMDAINVTEENIHQ